MKIRLKYRKDIEQGGFAGISLTAAAAVVGAGAVAAGTAYNISQGGSAGGRSGGAITPQQQQALQQNAQQVALAQAQADAMLATQESQLNVAVVDSSNYSNLIKVGLFLVVGVVTIAVLKKMKLI